MLVFLKKINNRLIYLPYLKSKLNQSGRNFRFGYGGVVNCPSSFSFGNDFFCGPWAYFSSNKKTKIIIGDKVMFGPYCKIIGGNHNIEWNGGAMMDAPQAFAGKGITVEDDVWCGASVLLLDGASLSEGSVIGAGSLVASYVPPYSIALGVPAKRFISRFDDGSLVTVLKAVGSKYTANEIRQLHKKHHVKPKEKIKEYE